MYIYIYVYSQISLIKMSSSKMFPQVPAGTCQLSLQPRGGSGKPAERWDIRDLQPFGKQVSGLTTAGQRTSIPSGQGPAIHTTLDQGIQLVRGISIYRWIGACYQSFESISIYTCTRTYIYMCVCDYVQLDV